MTTRLVWNCDHCGEPVDDGDGWLQCDYVAVGIAWEEAERRHGRHLPWAGGELLFMPIARWVATHKACDTSPNSDYWFDIARVRTDHQLMHWTAHLLEKNWIRHTDWSALLYRMLAQLGTVSA